MWFSWVGRTGLADGETNTGVTRPLRATKEDYCVAGVASSVDQVAPLQDGAPGDTL